ncbi:MAG: CAP domain-containing protein [Synergistaceae bacterium]|nr:CAP domain-containing protein [Synergistaceae bacterium]
MRLKNFPAFLLVILIASTPVHASGIYDTDPSFSPYNAGTVRSDILYDALEELNYIRRLIGVPSNVTLDSEMTRKAQHGAVLLDAINTLTHTPGKPSDMAESFYELGYDATTHGNIAWSSGGITINYSNKMYMNDSDSSNISAVGHRRWLMNPRMKRTGFGISERRGFAVTYVIDEDEMSSSWPIPDEYITWPVNKHPHPLTYFDAGTAWSVTLNDEIFETASTASTSVRLTRTSDGRTWNFGGGSSDGYFTINSQGYAIDQCIIFRPDNVSGYSNGETWNVYISGLKRKDGTSGSVSYSVTFTGESTGYEEDIPGGGTGSNDGDSSGGCAAVPGILWAVMCLVFLRKKPGRSALVVLLALSASCYAGTYDPYIVKPSFSPYRAGTVKHEILAEALAEVNYVRWLAGVPNNVTLNDEYTRLAQHGAVLLDANDELTHTPEKPYDMPQDFYEAGYYATSHGNIAYWKQRRGLKSWGAMTLSKSTQMYMEDTDGHNVGAIGHRRWLLNPRLKQTGFGISTRLGYAVTYVVEESPIKNKDKLTKAEYAQYLDWLKWPIADEFISWPSSKNHHPLSWFEAKTAWSVTLNRNVFKPCNPDNVSVSMTRLNDGKVWNFGKAGDDGYFVVAPDNVAYDECLIFCPDDIKSYGNGEYWRVEVRGLTRKDGSEGSFTYNVIFTL